MRFHSDLYLSEFLRKRPRRTKKIIRRIKRKNLVNDAYALSLKKYGGLMDMIYAPHLSKRFYPTDDIYIVGLAEDKKSAALLSADIIMEVYKKTGSFDVYDYFVRGENK